jgi:hypothetical protein
VEEISQAAPVDVAIGHERDLDRGAAGDEQPMGIGGGIERGPQGVERGVIPRDLGLQPLTLLQRGEGVDVESLTLRAEGGKILLGGFDSPVGGGEAASRSSTVPLAVRTRDHRMRMSPPPHDWTKASASSAVFGNSGSPRERRRSNSLGNSWVKSEEVTNSATLLRALCVT